MNRKQLSYRSMYLVLQKFVQDANPNLLAQMPNFNTAFQEFSTALENLAKASEKQLQDHTGTAKQKQAYQTEMINLTVNISNRMRAFAFNNKNWVLYNKVNRKKTLIIKLTQATGLDYCQMVHKEATALLPQLQPYGIHAQDLAQLQEAITKYLQWLPKPRIAIVGKRNQTRAVAQHLKTCANQVTAMTTYVQMLEYAEPLFYRQYHFSKKLVKPSYRKLPFRGIVTNENNVKLDGVIVKFKNRKEQTITSQHGNFQFKNLPVGTHNVIFEHEGYETITKKIVIIANQRTDINITLTEGVALKIAS